MRNYFDAFSLPDGQPACRFCVIGFLRYDKTRADLVLLNANPLDDITNTRRISSVYLRGVLVDRAPLRVSGAP